MKRLDAKLTKIRDLIDEKERIESELATLLGEQPKPKRHRRTKAEIEADRQGTMNGGQT